ncbi:MAG: PPK2 family polyphosphate kinase [Pseudomonadota bacterium]
MSQPSIKSVRSALIAAPGKTIALSDRPTRHPDLFEDKRDAEASLHEDAAAIDVLQDRLYADRSKALLVVLQGMDTAGKSGVIRKVFAETSPLGMQVRAFKAPTTQELAQDYLWRIHAATPPRGFIGIFDRSHYEDVLVVKVRDLAPADAVARRYEEINAFEKHLVDNGVVILKCMLNLSHKVQGERLRDRLKEPHKRWKFNPSDLEDRALWFDFMGAYETAVDRCSTPHAPWYVVPSDSKTRRNAMVARLVRGALEDIAPDYPDPGWKIEDHDFS